MPRTAVGTVTGRLHLLLGGQKSGKSTAATRLAADSGRHVVVIAPAEAGDDDEFRRRVARHQADRPDHWTTIETFDLTAGLRQAGPDSYVIIDALDTWLLEIADRHSLLDRLADDAGKEVRSGEASLLADVDGWIDAATGRPAPVTVVGGQPGLGPVAADRVTRRYVDLHGLVTQRIAARAHLVELVVADRRLPLDAPTSKTTSSPADRLDGRTTPDGGRSIAGLIGAVSPVDPAAAGAARRRHARLAKPPGSLGHLEDIGVQLAAIAARCPPPVPQRPRLLVAAGDHGVHDQHVSAWPQQLSTAIAQSILDGHATASVIAERTGTDLSVLDVGLTGNLTGNLTDHPRLRTRKPRRGTRDLTHTDAMTTDETTAAIHAGSHTARQLIGEGTDLLVVGEVGIANTTPTTALIAALTGTPPADIVGRGATPDDTTLAHKTASIEAGLERHGPDRDPLRLLAAVGGLEHAALTGALLAAAAARVPVILDGVTTVAAAIVATRLAPATAGYLIAGHRSTEPANLPALELLGLRPLLELDLRLGEGTGGLLAVPLVRTAAAVLNDVGELTDLTDPSAK